MSFSYGNILKELREKNKMTQTEFANLINKSTMYISNIENGKNGPLKGSDLNSILNILQVSESDIVKIKSAALLESSKIPEDISLYLRSNPGILELVVTLSINNINEREEEIIKKYYERIKKQYV